MIWILNKSTGNCFSKHRTQENAEKAVKKLNRQIPFGLAGFINIDVIFWNDKTHTVDIKKTPHVEIKLTPKV